MSLALAATVALTSCHARDARIRVMPESRDSRYAPAAALYREHCAACHGVTGEGNGPAASTFSIRPRQFRHESFHFISTTSGGAPAQDDIVRSIRRGVGPGMPARALLTDSELRQLADYVREIRRLGIIEHLTAESATSTEEEEDEYGYGPDEQELSLEQIEAIATKRVTPGLVTPVPPRPDNYQTDITVGRNLFALNCAVCHGADGSGNGEIRLKDGLGRPIRARALAAGDFRGGSRDQDLYRRIRYGIPGTPMAGFGQFTDEEVWQLVDYVRLLSKGRR